MKAQSQMYSRYYTYIKPVTRLPIIKTYGSTIFTILIIIIFIFFAIKPTVETIVVLQKKLSDTSQVLERINKKATDISLAKQNYDNLSTDIKDKISSAVPDLVQLKTIIQTLEQTAKLHEASISALQIQPLVIEIKPAKNKLGTLFEIDFTFNLEGTYVNLTSILQDLKASSRLISIDNLSISKLADGSGLVMSISGKAYYIK